MNFPEFSESKGILKIGRSEVCVWGGGAEGQTLKSRLPVFIYLIHILQVVDVVRRIKSRASRGKYNL